MRTQIVMIDHDQHDTFSLMLALFSDEIIMPSSVVAKMQYNPEAETLRIIYTSGSIYDYKKVPSEVYEEMRTALSKGTFLNAEIKGKYSFKKIK